MQTSNRNRFTLPLVSFLSLAASFSMIFVATAAPKAAPRRAGQNGSKPISSAPVNLGNGIFVLGDDTAPSSATVAPKRPIRSASASQVTRAAPTNLNAALVRFCRSYLGHKLGNGQCSELAMLGLPAIGAQMDLSNQWGTPVCSYQASGGRQYVQIAPAGKVRGNPRKANLKAGDIIQFENVKFEQRWDGGYSVKEYPHHTAVIEKISRDGNTLTLLEQNVNGTQFVLESRLYLPLQTEGIMRVSRPMPR